MTQSGGMVSHESLRLDQPGSMPGAATKRMSFSEITVKLYTDEFNNFVRYLVYGKKVPLEDAEDIVSECFVRLHKNFGESGKQYDELHKLMYGTMKLRCLEYWREEEDRQFFNKLDRYSNEELLSMNVSSVAERPPSYYRRKAYTSRPEVRAMYNKSARERYKRDPEKVLSRQHTPEYKENRRKYMRRYYMEKIRSDPIKYREKLDRRNSYRRKRRPTNKQIVGD